METQRANLGAATERSVVEPAEGVASGPPVLSVRLLGELSLRLGETPIPPLESARAESLLAYLLLHREAPQPRQRLAFLLWPDSTEQQARTNLRHVLHKLRRALPDADRFLDVTPRTLQWRTDAPYELDVARFERALERAAGAEGDTVVASLQEAVAAYGGDLLEGSYDEWLLEERENLRQRYLHALEQVARLLEERGEAAQAIPYAEALLRHDPLREEAYRLLMRLHDACGDRARALRVYHACTVTLERELGIDPSPATREAYEELLPTRDEDRVEGEVQARDRAQALVGRAAERARLTALWREAERGRPCLVLVSGEPGIGKTRLLEELRAWCGHRGAVTAEARSYAAEGALAYGPVVAWLRDERLAARRDRLDRGHLAELARLLPELAGPSGTDRPEPLSEAEQRQRLFDALAAAILTAGEPLLLVANDVHWCDRETLQFLHYLLRAAPEARLLVAATARREEVDADHPLNELTTGLHALERFEEIELERLSRHETAQLAGRTAGRTLAEEDLDRLFEETEGNPLFVVETLRSGWTGDEGGREWRSPRVQAVIDSRLAQLSPPARDLVGVAAAIGREFTIELLAAAAGAGDEILVRGLDELWRRRIMRELGADAYDFSHDKIREAAYAALSPALARSHHQRIAKALECHHAGDLDEVAGRIAAHYDRAGAARDAVDWYEGAAEAAQRRYADRDAVRALERALELAGELPSGPDRAALELRLLTALPAPLVAVDGYGSDRMVATHERALELAQALGVEPEAPLVRSLALASLGTGDFEAARDFGELLRARGEREHDGVLLVEGSYVLGIAAYWQGNLEAACTHFEAAVEHCRPEQRSAHLLHYAQDPEVICLTRLAHALWLLGEDEGARRARDAGLALADELGHPYTRVVAIIWGAVLALDQRDHDGLRAYLQTLMTTRPEDGPAQHRITTAAFAGLVELLDGRTEEGLERVRTAAVAARSREPAAPGFHGMLMHMLLEACARAGVAQEGLEAAEEMLGMGAGAQLWEAETRRLRAEFLAALGTEPAEVEAELLRALEVAERQGASALARRAGDSLTRFRAGTP